MMFASKSFGDEISQASSRLIGQSLSERLAQPFITENRPGANGNIAAEAVVRAPPDGYTLLLTSSSDAINTTFYDKLNFTSPHKFFGVRLWGWFEEQRRDHGRDIPSGHWAVQRTGRHRQIP